MRMGWPERVGGLGGSNLLARLPRRGAHGARPRRARHLLHARGAGADDDRLRAARNWRPRWCPACCAARRSGARGSPSRDRQQPGLARLPGHAHRRRLEDQRPEGVDEPGPVRTALRAPHAHRNDRVRAQGDHRAVHRHGQRRHHGAADRDDARRPGILRGLLRRRRGAAGPGPGRGRPGLVHRHGPPALRAQHGAVAPGRLPAAAAGAAGGGRARRCARPRRRGRGDRAPVGVPRPLAGDPAPAGGRRDPGSRDVRSTRCSWRRPSRRCSTSSAEGLGAEVALGDDPASQRWRAEFLYSRAATIYGGSAEIQRNIIARRLLDLGADR